MIHSLVYLFLKSFIDSTIVAHKIKMIITEKTPINKDSLGF